VAIINDVFVCIHFVFQTDDSWHIMTFSTSDGFVDNVIEIAIVFEKFPRQEVSVKDLMVHICTSGGMHMKFINAYVI